MIIYTVGNIIPGGIYRRPLYADGVRVGVVESNEGPAILGEMSEQQARERFPEFRAAARIAKYWQEE